jgi:hypothetical protein
VFRGVRGVRAVVIILGIIGLSGCADPPPALGGHFHGPIAEVRVKFDEGVKKRFPAGSAESVLHAELMRERFVIERGKEAPFSFTARYTAGELFCRADWVIRWSTFAGNISSIDADYGEICL